MRVMVIVKGTESSEGGKMPSQRALEDMTAFNEELVKAGIMQSGEGLHPSSKGKRIRFSGRSTSVVDGPFSESKELIAGFWIWQVKSMEEAVAWARRIPNTDGEDGEVELRPVFEAADFGEVMTPELHEKEEAMRAELERRARSS